MAVSNKEKLGYGVGATGLDLSYGLVCSFFIKYATDSLLISSVFVGVVMAVLRIFDGLNDPLMGTIVDNTRSKWGRFRPWILIGSVLNALVLVMMFTNPGLDPGGRGVYIYFTVAYLLWGLSYTMCDIPYWSFVPALTTDPAERNVISSVPRFFSGFGQLLVAGLTPVMLPILGKGIKNNGYSKWAVILAAFFVIFSVITVATTRERTKPAQKQKIDLKKTIKIIAGNDQLIIFILTAITFNTGWYLTSGLGVYFFDNVIEQPTMLSVFSIVMGAGQAVGLFGLVPLSKKIGKQNVVKLAMGCSAVGYLGMFLVSRLNPMPFIPFAVLAFVGCVGVGLMFVSQTSMLADVVDYGEYIQGERNESTVFSMKSFLLKFAQAIQALIIGAGLKIFNYDAKVVSQAPMTKNGICIMMFLVPPALALISFIIFSKKYKLYGDFMQKITDKIGGRNA